MRSFIRDWGCGPGVGLLYRSDRKASIYGARGESADRQLVEYAEFTLIRNSQSQSVHASERISSARARPQYINIYIYIYMWRGDLRRGDPARSTGWPNLSLSAI